jgi:type IV secretion system protein VirB8
VDKDPKLDRYFRDAATWSQDRERSLATALRRSWVITAITSTIAILEAVAIVALTPLKTTVPYTLLVDRQTGSVQTLKPLDDQLVAPDAALTRSLLAQYVIARAEFDLSSLKSDYQKVALWSAGDARARYIAETRASNPASPIATLPRDALIEVQIRGISSLSADTSLVRFTTTRTDPGGQDRTPQLWSAVIRHRFSAAGMSGADRLINPLGFQVFRYRQNADTAPGPAPAPTAAVSSATRQTSNADASDFTRRQERP